MHIEHYFLSSGEDLTAWDKFVDLSPQGSIFCKSWWLRATCEDDFKILCLKDGNDIAAGIALPFQKKYGLKIIKSPPLTQTLGVLFSPQINEKYLTNLSRDMRLQRAIIHALPEFDYFRMGFHYNFTNWLPFYWSGFQESTRYTYVIENLSNHERVLQDLSDKTRNQIRKAEKQGIEVSQTEDISLFIQLYKKTYERQNLSTPHSESLLFKINKASKENNARIIFVSRDREGRAHSAIFVVFDRKSAYYLMQGSNFEFRNSCSTYLTQIKSIEYFKNKTEKYDFEGSILENIECVFRDFGGVQKRYFDICKVREAILPRGLMLGYSIFKKLKNRQIPQTVDTNE